MQRILAILSGTDEVAQMRLKKIERNMLYDPEVRRIIAACRRFIKGGYSQVLGVMEAFDEEVAEKTRMVPHKIPRAMR